MGITVSFIFLIQIVFSGHFSLASGAEKLTDKSARKLPPWVKQITPPKNGVLYFVGIHSKASNLEDGRDGALIDAASQISNRIGVSISTRHIARKSKTESLVIDDGRTASQAFVEGCRMEDLYWERWRETNTGASIYKVWVLIAYDEKALLNQKNKAINAKRAYDDSLRSLCLEIRKAAPALKLNALTVSGFTEQITEKRYSLSRVIESDLSTQLASLGVKVSPAPSQFVLTGNYREQNNSIRIASQIYSKQSKSTIFAKTIEIPKGAIDPEWLKLEFSIDDPYFSDLETESIEKQETGHLTVVSNPPGADVFLNTESKGKTNVTIHDVPVGSHSLLLTLSNFEDVIGTVTVRQHGMTQFNAKLNRRKGTLSIRSNPPGAKIWLDGRFTARNTPFVFSELLEGPHQIRLQLAKHKDYIATIEVPYRDTGHADIALVEMDGSLLVKSNPPGAKVFLNDTTLGTIQAGKPFVAQNIPSGEAILRLELLGYEEWEGTVLIRPNTVSTQVVNLKKATFGQLKIETNYRDIAVSINGEDAGVTDGDGFLTVKLPSGKHTVTIQESGYDDWKREINVRPGEETFLKADITKIYQAPDVKLNAGLKSLVFPGWGQYQNNEDRKGLIVGCAFWGSVLFAAVFAAEADASYDEYQQTTDPQMADYYYDDAKAMDQTATAFSWIAVGFWAYGVIDATVVQNQSGNYAQGYHQEGWSADLNPKLKETKVVYTRRF
ncbi:MAG: hypothetical protein KCHDKBKB_01603 [Elusimicrobia bacterium]|nr:hypothetical protein [Elusimicrobiota bacterium]